MTHKLTHTCSSKFTDLFCYRELTSERTNETNDRQFHFTNLLLYFLFIFIKFIYILLLFLIIQYILYFICFSNFISSSLMMMMIFFLLFTSSISLYNHNECFSWNFILVAIYVVFCRLQTQYYSYIYQLTNISYLTKRKRKNYYFLILYNQ